MSVRVMVETEKIAPKINRAIKGAQHIIDQQVLKDCNLYIPADTWALRDSSLSASQIGEGRLVWNTPYARRQYYGTGFNFSHDKNPRAQALWYEKAKSVHGNEWVEVAQKAVEKGL